MATYFVASGGSNTAPYDTWAKAATSLQTALTAANASGDVVVIQHNAIPATDSSGAGITYTVASNITVISASNDGGSAYTPTAMGTANGLTRTAGDLVATGAFKVLWHGVTFRTTGGSAFQMRLGTADGGHYGFDDCYIWSDTTAGSNASIQLGNGSNSYVRVKNCTLRFGATGSRLGLQGRVDVIGGSVSSDGSAPTTLVPATAGAHITFSGTDLSFITGTLIGSADTVPVSATFDRCKFGTGYTLIATQSTANKSTAVAWAYDCSVGDVHGLFQYADAFGSVISDTGIFYTSGAAAQSFKIVTTANCSFATPFVTPPIALYNSATSAITPYLEILRDGSTTAYNNNQVWAEFMAKVTSGSTQATFYSDRMAIAGTPAAQANGAGLGSWTGESGTAWSGKIDSGSSLTPAEVGDISVCVAVGVASSTVYVDPQIRT